MKFAALFLVVGAFYGAQSSEIFCFTCSYTDQKRCIVANNLPSETCPLVTEADKKLGHAAVCVTTINPSALNNKRYDRGCRQNRPGADFCTDYMAQNNDSTCFACHYKLCNGLGNGANDNVVKLWMFLLAVIIVMYMQHQT